MPSQIRITADDRGPLVNLANWVTLVVACLATLTKIATKLRKIRRLQGDDYIMLAAMLSAVGQSIAVGKQVSAGLGRHINTLTLSQIKEYQKAGYIAELFYILTLSLPKFAVLHFLKTIAIGKVRRRAQMVVVVANFLWVFISMIAIAVQCAPPWAIISEKCFNQPAFWNVVGTVDILVNIAIIALPIWILFELQVPRSRKLTIMSAFAIRVVLIPLALIRMLYIGRASNSLDHPYDDLHMAVVTQVDMNLSILFACFIFLKPFMDGLQTGLLASDIHILDPKKSHSTGSGSAGGFAMGSWSKIKRSGPSKNGVDLGPHRRLGTQETLEDHTIVTIDQPEQVYRRPDVRGKMESERTISERGAKDAIKKTTVIAQHYERRPDQTVGAGAGGRKKEKGKDDIEMFSVR